VRVALPPLLELTNIVAGEAEADIEARFACHLPLELTVAVTVWVPKVTVMVAPTSPDPNTGTVVPRCKTMFELNIGETVNAPKADVDVNAPVTSAARSPALFLLLNLYFIFARLFWLLVAGSGW